MKRNWSYLLKVSCIFKIKNFLIGVFKESEYIYNTQVTATLILTCLQTKILCVTFFWRVYFDKFYRRDKQIFFASYNNFSILISDCGIVPKTVDNSDYELADGLSVGNRAFYTCRTGYRSTVEDRKMYGYCRPNGNWATPNFTCELGSCFQLYNTISKAMFLLNVSVHERRK